MGAEILDAETLDVGFYRERARLCLNLADAARSARPLFARLCVLAKTYEEKARAAESILVGGRATRDS
jgi:hypothetical protein